MSSRKAVYYLGIFLYILVNIFNFIKYVACARQHANVGNKYKHGEETTLNL